MVRFSSWKLEEVCLGGTWRRRVGTPRWSHLTPEEVGRLVSDEATVPNESLRQRKAVKVTLRR